MQKKLVQLGVFRHFNEIYGKRKIGKDFDHSEEIWKQTLFLIEDSRRFGEWSSFVLRKYITFKDKFTDGSVGIKIDFFKYIYDSHPEHLV